jgi:hypothetical protein
MVGAGATDTTIAQIMKVAAGKTLVTCTVSDNRGGNTTKSVYVDGEAPGTATLKVDATPSTTTTGQSVTVTATATNIDLNTAKYVFFTSSGTFAKTSTPSIETLTTPSAAGPVVITVAVSDGSGATAVGSATVTVN